MKDWVVWPVVWEFVLSVVASAAMALLMFHRGETFDAETDTRTSVNKDHRALLRFSGRLKIDFQVQPEQLPDTDCKVIAERLTRARD